MLGSYTFKPERLDPLMHYKASLKWAHMETGYPWVSLPDAITVQHCNNVKVGTCLSWPCRTQILMP